MLKISLSKLPYFDTPKVALLNRLVRVNKSLMPHTIAGATGCRISEAMALLLLLYAQYAVDGFILIYHKAHLEFYVEKRPIEEGLPPRDNYFCPICEETAKADDLFYSFEFDLVKDVQFAK